MTPPDTPTDDRRQIFYLMSVTLRLLRADLAGRVRTHALTPALIRLVLYVQRNPGCRQVELADFLDIRPVTVGQMIDRLERRGLLRRESDPGDRRAYRVHLETRAQPLMAELDEQVGRALGRAFDGFTARDSAQLLAAIGRVHANLSVERGDAQSPTGVTGGR